MSIDRRTTKSGSVRYDVRLRTPEGRQYMRAFKTKREAERFHASEVTDRARGAWIDPGAGRMTFGSWVVEWFDSMRHSWRSRTTDKHEMALRVHWVPRFGAMALASISPRQVQAAVVGPEWRCLIYLGGVLGLRFGEATALKSSRH